MSPPDGGGEPCASPELHSVTNGAQRAHPTLATVQYHRRRLTPLVLPTSLVGSVLVLRAGEDSCVSVGEAVPYGQRGGRVTYRVQPCLSVAQLRDEQPDRTRRRVATPHARCRLRARAAGGAPGPSRATRRASCCDRRPPARARAAPGRRSQNTRRRGRPRDPAAATGPTARPRRHVNRIIMVIDDINAPEMFASTSRFLRSIFSGSRGRAGRR